MFLPSAQVVDRVLKEHGVSDQILYNRAKVHYTLRAGHALSNMCLLQGLLLIGAIFKQTVPDETDEERRELERCVSVELALL